MQWDPSPGGGFTTGTPWLPLVDPAARNVADQSADESSVLELYRAAIALRPRLGPDFRFAEPIPDVVAYERGEHVVAINVSSEERPAPPAGEVVLHTHGRRDSARLGPHEGFVALRRPPG
jgi:alpha-glucosidase